MVLLINIRPPGSASRNILHRCNADDDGDLGRHDQCALARRVRLFVAIVMKPLAFVMVLLCAALCAHAIATIGHCGVVLLLPFAVVD